MDGEVLGQWMGRCWGSGWGGVRTVDGEVLGQWMGRCWDSGWGGVGAVDVEVNLYSELGSREEFLELMSALSSPLSHGVAACGIQK